MKNTFGNAITITLFGESHGPAVGAVLDGLAPGLAVDEERMRQALAKRRPQSAMDTARKEQDHFQILSGVFEGKTTGSPLTIMIPNEDTKSRDYQYGPARPSHADYAAYCKYHGFEDYRGGGHFSGRITAALVAAGGILIPALEKQGITIGTRIRACAGIEDADLSGLSTEELKQKMAAFSAQNFPVADAQKGAQMQEKILEAGKNADSVGGITETFITGVPAGLGEPWFDSVESELSHILYSLGGIKGVEFGDGFALAQMKGSEANDRFRIGEDGQVYTQTNRSGGINGGITNGMPIRFCCAVKPTASISQTQETIDFCKNENLDYQIKGRHDPAIIRRICPVIDSVSAIAVCDLLTMRFGTDFLAKGADA